MKNLIPFLLIFSLIFTACDEVATDTSAPQAIKVQTEESAQALGRTIAVAPASPKELEKVGQTVAFSSFNQKIESAKNEEWVQSPFQVALKFGGDQMEARKKTISAESLSGGESFNKLIVTIEEDGLLDDSIKGSMLILRMERNAGIWKVNKATRVWKCWPKRGHAVYNSEPCS